MLGFSGWHSRRRLLVALFTGSVVAPCFTAPIPMTQKDFYTPGTQPGDLDPGAFMFSAECRACHGDFDSANEPFATWQGSLMAMAGRDPLFFAQMTTANQDVANVGS